MALVYTTIQHVFRKENKLSCNEYILADMVYYLSTSPESKVKGWCYMSRTQIAEELGLSKQSILNLIEGLITKGFLEKSQEKALLRTTTFWNTIYFTSGKESLPPSGKESLLNTGKESLPGSGKESLPYNTIVDNNKNDNIIIPLVVDTTNGAPSQNSVKAKDAKKGNPPSPPLKSCYDLFMEKYWEWFKARTDGVPPKIDGAGGNAAKAIIKYLNTIVRARAGDISEADLCKEVLRGWDLVLDNWGILEPFLQDKTRLIEINSNIQNIIVQIKNNGTTKKNQQSSNGKASTNGVIDAINNRFNKAAGSPGKQ